VRRILPSRNRQTGPACWQRRGIIQDGPLPRLAISSPLTRAALTGAFTGSVFYLGRPDDIREMTGNEYLGRGYNSLLLSLLHAMGVTPAEYETPGINGFGSYSTAGVVDNQYSIADAQEELPFIKK
jgi:hypothetical protein